MCNDVGCATQVLNGSQMLRAEDYTIVGSSDAKFVPPPTIEEMEQKLHQVAIEHLQSLSQKQPNCSMRYEDGMIVVDELTKLPMGIIATNMSQDDLKQSGFPILFVKGDPRKSKSKKHYKPKFTL